MEATMENKKVIALALVATLALCSVGFLFAADDAEAEPADSTEGTSDNGTADLCAVAFAAVTIVAFAAACVMLFWKKEE